MKISLKYWSLGIVALFLLLGCQDDDQRFGDIIAPSNVELMATVLNSSEEEPFGDGSGAVTFVATAKNAINYSFKFGDGAAQNASSDGVVTHSYTKNGVNRYTVTVIAYGIGGTASSKQIEVEVRSDFDDPETTRLLTGGDSKTWYVAKNLPAHLGVGPAEGTSPDYYQAAPNEKVNDPCFYNDELVFTLQEGGAIVYQLNNQGETFFNAAYLDVAGGAGGADQCLHYDTSGAFNVALASADSGMPEGATTGTQIVFGDNSFMSYYIGSSNYEILEITENYMHVRAVMGNDPSLAWYLKFTTDPEGDGSGNNGEDPGSDELETQFSELIWEQDFKQEGVLNPEYWNFETGNNDGWGNQEVQYYTENNAFIEDGVLKITARKENVNGFNYTSSRITTQDKFSFTYGRIEVRAKLPAGKGTWPAIWMLGSNFKEVGWPESGEIDIMEHAGNDPGLIHGTVHLPGNFGGNAISETTRIEGVSDQFNDYTLEWRENQLLFAVNNQLFHTYDITPDSPFNQPFFIILNVAMGGTFGGGVADDFEAGTLEVEHIKVFQ